MAPTKKTKKTADSINSRLALVMKSGKGTNTSPQVTIYAGAKVSLTISSQSQWAKVYPEDSPIESEARYHCRQLAASPQE
jgi:hypothetical protein